VLGRLVRAALDALFGAAAEALARWRRDRALARLGYSEAQRDAARARERARATADEIDRRPVPGDVRRTLERL